MTHLDALPVELRVRRLAGIRPSSASLRMP